MTGDTAFAASVIVGHTVTWSLVAVLTVATVRRWREPRFALVAGALATVAAGWNVMLASPTVSPVAQGAATAALPVLLATYPDGRFVPRWLAAPVLVLAGCGALAMVLGPVLTGSPWWRLVNWATLLLLVAQVHRYRRRATTEERASVRWAILATLLPLSVCVGLLLLAGTTVEDGGPSATLALVDLVIVLMPVGFAIGLLRPQLADVDAGLRLVVAALVVLVAAGSAHAVTLAVMHRLAADPTTTARVGALVAVAVALPTARFALRLADRLVYRDRPDPGLAAARLGRALADEPDAGRVADVVVRTVAGTLGMEDVRLRVGDVVWAGPASDAGGGTVVPITYQDEPVATLVVRPRRGETSLTRRDLDVLRRLALHAAPALRGARAMAELTDARSRLVRLRAEERKALRRDIHDDLGPTLAGLGLGAAAVAALVKDGDSEAAVVADSLVHDVHSAMAQVRELAHDLRPPILDDEGLVATVRARVQGGPDTPVVQVHAPAERLTLPAAVEVAALRIVQEAVSNVRRHARATRCHVEIGLRASVLHLCIADDGAGFPADADRRGGLGLASIRERARELGGTAHRENIDGGGARIRVSLPCDAGLLDAAASWRELGVRP